MSQFSSLHAPVDPALLEAALATMTLADLESRAIAAMLSRYNNNRTRAARALGISVRTLQRKLSAKHSDPSDAPLADPSNHPA